MQRGRMTLPFMPQMQHSAHFQIQTSMQDCLLQQLLYVRHLHHVLTDGACTGLGNCPSELMHVTNI